MQCSLTPQQQQAIVLLNTGAKFCKVAETLGISPDTLWRWRKLPEFKRVQQERHALLRAEMTEQCIELMRLSLVSLTRELSLVDDPKYYNRPTTALNILRLLQPGRLLTTPEGEEQAEPE
jgi:transposase-like protein